MNTIIDTAVLGRMATPLFLNTDPTIEGFPKPFAKKKEPTPSRVKDLTRDELMSIYNGLSDSEKLNGLIDTIEEYCSYTVFSVHLRSKIKSGATLEDLINSVKYSAKQAKNLPSIFLVPFSDKLLQFSRRWFINKITQEREETSELGSPELLVTRHDWTLNVANPLDIYKAYWFLWSETVPEVTEEASLLVAESEFTSLTNNLDIDMCEEAIRQALILFYGRDPIEEEPV